MRFAGLANNQDFMFFEILQPYINFKSKKLIMILNWRQPYGRMANFQKKPDNRMKSGRHQVFALTANIISRLYVHFLLTLLYMSSVGSQAKQTDELADMIEY